jgi:hypothetical protein
VSANYTTWKLPSGRTIGYVRDGTYHIRRVIFGRRVRLSTGCATEDAALAEYAKFERAPTLYVSPLGRRAFAGVGTKGRAQRPSAANDAHRRRLNVKYRLTPEAYAALLAEQAGCCAICGRRAEESTGKVLSIDHDHETGRVRGLLCSHCNRGLGHFLDSEPLLRVAADYLLERRQGNGPGTLADPKGDGRSRENPEPPVITAA